MLYVFQGEFQRLIGTFVDYRNDVAKNAISLWVHRSRGCRGGSSSRGYLLGLGLSVGAFRLVSVLRLVGIFLPVSVLRLVCAFQLVCAFRFLSVLRLGRGTGW